MNLCPETFPIIQGHEPVASNALATCDYISLKNAKGVMILVHQYGGAGVTNLVLTVNEATDITPTGATALIAGAEFQIWVNADTSLTDTMVRQTDAVTYTIDTGAQKDQIVAIYIDASILSAGFDCVALHSTGGFATNLVSVTYILDGARYQQETPPTAIA